MEILQPTWKGRSVVSRKDSGGKHTAMVGQKSLLYMPVNILPNAVYKITLELRNESGNGILYCNLYGSKSFDFPHSKIICERGSWTSFDIDIVSKDFPKTVPMVFRLWRGKEGTGTILVKRIIVKLEEGPVENISAVGKIVSARSGGVLQHPATTDSTPNIPPPRDFVNIQKKQRMIDMARKDYKEQRKEVARKASESAKKSNGIEYFKHHNVVDGGKKVLYLPANNTQIFQTGMYDAFIENGFELYTFDFRNFCAIKGSNVDEAFLKVCRNFRPDWIHMQLQFTGMISANCIKTARNELVGTKITNWTGDIRQEIKPYFIEIGKQVSLSLISSLGQVSLYKKYGCPNVEYWQVGFDPKIFRPLSSSEKIELTKRVGHDVVFCAIKTNHFPDSQLRYKTVQALNKNFGKRFAIYGDGWEKLVSSRGSVSYYGQNRVYNGSKIAINVNHFNNVEMYFSDRQLITMASGTPVVCKYIPGLERYFENKKDVAWFNSVDECVELVSYYLQHPKEAATMGASGAKKVIEQHSYKTRVKELAMRIGLIKSSEELVLSKREVCCKKEIIKVLGIVPDSPDKLFKFRKTYGKIEFQGVFANDDIKRIAAEFQPDLIHFFINDKMINLASQIRIMDGGVVLSCVADSISNVDTLPFDYVITNSISGEVNTKKPHIILINKSLPKSKARTDVVEEIKFILGVQ